MVKIFLVSYYSEGQRVFFPESLTAKQAQAMGKALGIAKLRPAVHKIVMSPEQAAKLATDRRVVLYGKRA